MLTSNSINQIKKSTYFISFIVIVLQLTSCFSNKVFIPVKPQTNISAGAKYVIVNSNEQDVKSAFNNKGILTKTYDGGFETESIIINENLRVMYKAHVFDNQVRISSFWGLTQRGKTQASTFVDMKDYNVDSWEQVIYTKTNSGPKTAFDYAVEIVENSNLPFEIK